MLRDYQERSQCAAQPRQIDEDLVRAQETRRIIDRLYGYEVSPLLWRKVRPRLSAGRVQSVAVRLIVERERQRMAFVAATYWDLLGLFTRESGDSFQASLISVDGRRIPASRDFDAATGQLKDRSLMLLDQRQADELAERVRRGTVRVSGVDKPYVTRPYGRLPRARSSRRPTVRLYGPARCRLPRACTKTDILLICVGLQFGTVAVTTARDRGQPVWPGVPVAGAPFIRPVKTPRSSRSHSASRSSVRFPGNASHQTDGGRVQALRLDMEADNRQSDGRCEGIGSITVDAEGAIFQVSGKTIEFPGYLRAYVEGSDDPEADLADKEILLPKVTVNEPLVCSNLESKSHTTQPPNRFSEASLTRALEEMGIGRPSTYAAIIDTILARNYVFKRGNSLVPTWVAFAVCQLLESHLPNLVDYRFTAALEDELDAISRGEQGHLEYLRRFYFGNGHPGLKKQLENKVDEIDARDVNRIFLGKPDGEPEVYARVGKLGPFLEHGERRASIPEKMAPDELTLEVALELLRKSAQGDEPLGICPETGKPVFLKIGRFGPYVQRGTPDDDEKRKCVVASGHAAGGCGPDLALKLLSYRGNWGSIRRAAKQSCKQADLDHVKCGGKPARASDLSLDVTVGQYGAVTQQSARGVPQKEPIKVSTRRR